MSLTGHNMRRRRQGGAQRQQARQKKQVQPEPDKTQTSATLEEKNQKAIEQAMATADANGAAPEPVAEGEQAEAAAPDLDSMTVGDLRTLAKGEGITLARGVSRKEEIVAAIKEGRAQREG